MSYTFTKLFSSITESTVWMESDKTRIVWITMLAMADRFGRVWASIPGLANRARVPVEDCRIAIDRFLAPDPDSRTHDFDGRRIEPIDGGWRLLNHEKYRVTRDEDTRREQNREAKRRERMSAKKSACQPKSATSQPRSAQADADAETDRETEEDHTSSIAPDKPAENNWVALKNALASVDGSQLDQITGRNWSFITKLLKEIIAVSPDATPAEIAKRAERYRKKWPNVTCTPGALVKHWGVLAPEAEEVPRWMSPTARM